MCKPIETCGSPYHLIDIEGVTITIGSKHSDERRSSLICAASMELLQLPPEILSRIMHYVGSSFFCEDVGRLTVSKQWYEFALNAFVTNLKLSIPNLRRLRESKHLLKRTLVSLKDNLEALHLEFDGFDNPIYFPPQPAQALSTELGVPGAWFNALNADLAQLAALVQTFGKLRSIRVEAPSGRFHSYLTVWQMRSLLSTQNLMVLDLDLCGTALLPRLGNDHICTTISSLLGSLKRLRLRMHRICPDALIPPPNITSLRLSEVLIHLTIVKLVPDLGESVVRDIISTHSCLRCNHKITRFLKLKEDIEGQAKALVDHMASPKCVRVLYCHSPTAEIRSLDILTGRYMILEHGMAWEDDGEPEEEPSDTESDIASLSE